MSTRARTIYSLPILLLVCVACTVQPATAPAAPTTTPVLLPTATLTPAPPATSMPTPTPTLQPTIAVEPTSTDTPLPSPNAETYAVVGVAMDDVLNVRARPGVEHAITSVIPPYGTGIQTFGTGEQVGASLWLLIRYEGSTGWVNGRYLARQVGRTDDSLAARATAIIQAIDEEDWKKLSGFVHPDKGLRFSPYTFVRVEPDANQEYDLVFGAAQVMDFSADQTVYRWGRFDGTGEPIELTVDAYWSRFIYDADFWQPHAVGYGEFIGKGNTINNISQVYPQAVTVEYHFAGFEPQFEGLDWRSLRLVLEEQAGIWYLVGIVHDEWTI
jgi:hypothetical protein